MLAQLVRTRLIKAPFTQGYRENLYEINSTICTGCIDKFIHLHKAIGKNYTLL